jgi:hypothetical protein
MEKEDSKKLEERVEIVHTTAENAAKEVGALHKRKGKYKGELWKGMYCIKYEVIDGEKGKEISMGTKRFSLDKPNDFAEAYIERFNEIWNQYENKEKPT